MQILGCFLREVSKYWVDAGTINQKLEEKLVLYSQVKIIFKQYKSLLLLRNNVKILTNISCREFIMKERCPNFIEIPCIWIRKQF